MVPMLSFYCMVLILIGMVYYADWVGTIRVFAYLDLQLRFAWVKLRMHFMRQRLKRDLRKAGLEYEKLFKELNK